MKIEKVIFLFSLLFISSYCDEIIINDGEFVPPKTRALQGDSLKFISSDSGTDNKAFLPNNDIQKVTPLNKYKESILAKLIASSTHAEGTISNTNTDNQSGRILRKWQADDDAKKFFYNEPFDTVITRLPVQGKAKKTPWSGYYWAIRYGVGSVRYSDDPTINTMYKVDGNVKSTRTWQDSVNFYKQPLDYNKQLAGAFDLSTYVAKYASPTEMYDIAVGDKNFTLTNYYKNLGNTVKQSDGDIATWMGICHGWSIASYMEPKPLKSVTITAADGKTKIKFKPHDIMAIASMHWANAKFVSNFVGYMCDIYDPAKIPTDPVTGISTEYACWGLNPGTFHIILTNHMGKNGNTFIFDPDNTDYQIWNFPMSDYKIDYYQVTTKYQKTIGTAPVSIANIKTYLQTNKDDFLSFVMSKVDPTTAYIIGVRATVNFAVEKMPDNQDVGTKDLFNTSTIYYYLECDKYMRIIGGEWKAPNHVNFVWGPHRSTDVSITNEDKIISQFTGTVSELATMTKYAVSASGRGSPLRAFMKFLTTKTSVA
jgi:hypothetical protein